MFGFSGSKSSSRSLGTSQATSFSFGESASSSRQGSESGSVSGGMSTAGSQDQATARSGQSIAFEDVFARLFGNAESVAGNLDTSMLTQASNQLFAGGTDFLAGIGGDVGTGFLKDRLGGSSKVLEGQLGLLQEDIGQLFREELLPGITSEAVRGGQLGGGRQGVAEGKALEASADAFSRGSVELMAADQAQRDSIAEGIASRSLQGSQVGLGSLTDLMTLMESAFGAQTAPTEFLARILGDSKVLTQSESQSSGTSFSDAMDFARAFSQSFGESSASAFDRAGSQSSSRTESTSKSKSFGLSFGS